MLVEQIEKGKAEVEIQYRRGVNPEGNPGALAIMEEIFEPRDAPWRGLGIIPRGGLGIREAIRGPRCQKTLRFIGTAGR